MLCRYSCICGYSLILLDKRNSICLEEYNQQENIQRKNKNLQNEYLASAFTSAFALKWLTVFLPIYSLLLAVNLVNASDCECLSQ